MAATKLVGLLNHAEIATQQSLLAFGMYRLAVGHTRTNHAVEHEFATASAAVMQAIAANICRVAPEGQHIEKAACTTVFKLMPEAHQHSVAGRLQRRIIAFPTEAREKLEDANVPHFLKTILGRASRKPSAYQIHAILLLGAYDRGRKSDRVLPSTTCLAERLCQSA